jgi:DNA-binding response OmpR family regulator
MEKKKILIIDDDAELGDEMAEFLAAEGYSADNISDGLHGLELIRKNSYDIFLLDYKMKDITGVDLLKVIKQRDPNAAIFFISGKPGLESILKTENLLDVIKGIIEKPFDTRSLLDKIKSC